MSHLYSRSYKEEVFWIWYNHSRCPAHRLISLIHQEDGNLPAVATLSSWISDWSERADEIDQEARDQFTKEVIETKVEMLRRHAEVGKEMLNIGAKWVRDNTDKLTANAAVRLIREGHDLERSSVGVPEALEKMLTTSDEELVKQIEDIITGDDIIDASLP